MIRRGCFLCGIVLFALASAWAVAEPTPEELALQRRQFEAWRKHPEQLARLRHDLQSFQAAKPERREQITKLDQEIHSQESTEQAKLLNVLKHYGDWLDRIPEKDRQAIKQAPNSASRLALIREMRDGEWLSVQPKSVRVEWETLKGAARADLVKKLRLQEQQRHQQWLFATRFWRELESKQPMPTKLSDFTDKKKDDKKGDDKTPDKVQRYVTEYLLPMLSDAEKKRLAAAEGKWPDYPQTLVSIAAEHPAALPPRDPKDLPMQMAQLPAPIQARITDKKGIGKLKLLKGLPGTEGQPGFATKVVELATKKGVAPFEFEFWASSLKALQPPMRDFVTNKLIPTLNTVEKSDLNKVEGAWPFYPQLIQELSDKKNLQPPWHILPEPEKWKWDLYRESRPKNTVQGFPAVPNLNLREFALFELTALDWDKLKLSPRDPDSIPRLVEAYYLRNPQELRRLESVDRRKRADRLQTLSLPTKTKNKQGT